MSKPNRGGRGSVETWLRQKYRTLKTTVPKRRQTVYNRSHNGSAPNGAALAAWRELMWVEHRMGSTHPDYRKTMAAACAAFDALMAREARNATTTKKGRRRGKNIHVGRSELD